MTQYEVEDLDISEFRPSQRQLLAKTKLHQFVPSGVIGALTPDGLVDLRGYLFPISIEEVKEWHINNRVFWFWFTIANEQVTQLFQMKGLAVDAIRNILTGDIPDSKLTGIQLRAAQLLLDLKESPSKSVNNSTVNIAGDRQRIPRALQKKSTIELQEELKRLDTKNNQD